MDSPCKTLQPDPSGEAHGGGDGRVHVVVLPLREPADEADVVAGKPLFQRLDHLPRAQMLDGRVGMRHYIHYDN